MKTAGEPLTILLVEDNADHAELARRALADAPHPLQVQQVATGEAALEWIHAQWLTAGWRVGLAPDLVVLLDLHLPGMAGLEVLRELRRLAGPAELPVVVLTTSTTERDRGQAAALQANGWLTKPLDAGAMSGLLHTLGPAAKVLAPCAGRAA